MVTARHVWLSLIAVALLGTALAGCGKLNLGGGGSGPIPSASPTATASPWTAPCATQNPASNVVYVAMSSAIVPVSVQKYGTIGEFAVITGNTVPAQAALINQYVNGAGNTVPITTNNLLQFVNLDPAFVNRSAVGFKGNTFPRKPYAFPSPAASPTASTVSNVSLWSTGRIPAGSSAACFSQTFKLNAGSYFFGDLDLYNLGPYQNVIIVSTPAP